MTEEYLRGVVGEATVTRSNRSYGRAAGLPSPTEGYEHKVVNIFNGRWRVGEPLLYTQTVAVPDPAIIPSLVKFVEQQGMLGEPLAFTDADYDSDTATLTIPGLDYAERTDDWCVWINASSGTFTKGVYYVASATDNVTTPGDADCVLDNTVGVAPPGAGNDQTVSGYLLKNVYAEVYHAIPAPAESSSRDQIPANNDSQYAISPWMDYGIWIPPATLVGGGMYHLRLKGRIRLANMSGRPYSNTGTLYDNDDVGKVALYLTIDPFSSALVINSVQHNETAWTPQVASIVGWTPENRFTSPTVTSYAGAGLPPPDPSYDPPGLRFAITSHGLSNLDVVCVVSGNDQDPAAVPDTMEVGAHYFVQRADAVPANRFHLTTSGENQDDTRIQAGSVFDVPLIVARQPQRGSRFALTWKFTFDTADALEDYQECEIDVWAFGDGKTVNTEEGTIWNATLRILPVAEDVGVSGRPQELVPASEKVISGTIFRTTPGNTMVQDFDAGVNVEDATGAPQLLAKLSYWTPTDTITVTDATTEAATDTISSASMLSLKPADEITITTASASGLSLQAYNLLTYLGGRDSFTINNGSNAALALSNSTANVAFTAKPSYAAYYSTMWDYGGNYDIVQLDAALISGGNSITGESEYPIAPTYQGVDVTGFTDSRKNSSAVRRATITEVEVGGEVIGEVCQYDNVRRLAFVRVFTPGEHIQNGDALTFKTYRNVRSGSGTTWAFESSAVQTKTADALLVKHGPHGTRLSTRIAMSGPPTGDCQLDIRGGVAEIWRVRSR